MRTDSNKGRYMQLLLRDFHALESLIKENKLERGITRIGYELELNFLDRHMEPAAIGTQIRDKLDDSIYTTEFSVFNLEINSRPLKLEGACFSELADSLHRALGKIKHEANALDCDVLLTGIIPTLTQAHITPEALTPEPRYQQLYKIRRALKGEEFEYNIHGVDELKTRDNIALFAGCVTSFQVHLQIDAEDTVDQYNWAQLLAGPLLSCATNSPLFLGKRLWHETRIALFQQATDMRNPDSDLLRNRPRVFFGDHWLHNSALELLQEDIASFNTLFTLDNVEDPSQAMARGEAPGLEAWSQFNASIYRWNRLCYGTLDGRPSLRIENRILPSGPTVSDMVANAVFWTGAMAGLPDRYRNLQERLPFEEVQQNFFKAARLGLDVKFRWLDGQSVSARELILDELLPIARQGLKAADVDELDLEHNLDIIRARTDNGKTGSNWMLDSFTGLLKTSKPHEALQTMTAGMLCRQYLDTPVHTWKPVQPEEGEARVDRFDQVRSFMTTTLYKVAEDDVLDLAAHIMEWKSIGHIPVEDAAGYLVGIINKDAIINFMVNAKDRSAATDIGELMIRDPVTAHPDTSLKDAIDLLLEHGISCLPVVSDARIVGIVTERDLLEVSRVMLACKSTQGGQR